jgi:hypothetical protein
LDPSHFLYPSQVAEEINAAVTGHRVIARDVKETRKYLARLFSAASVPLCFKVADYDQVALSLHIGSVTFATLSDRLMESWFQRDVAGAAQTAAGLIQGAARKLERLALDELREISEAERGSAG